ncbi:MAG: tRNA pseudouridine(13) synthase TruD [Halobacteriaceae archaeon]
MMDAHPIERRVGVRRYVTAVPGTGGRLRRRPEDFRVTELEDFAVEPLDADPGAYPHLVVRATLRGWDTNDFARALSDRLGMSRERVSWAGTKDKHAVTTQLVSVRAPDLDPADLPDLPDARVEPVGRAGRALEFGDLAGNAFDIVVREADAPDRAPAVAAQLRRFAATGTTADDEAESAPGADATGTAAATETDGPAAVPNYFGQQRFGSQRAVTHEVGLALLDGSWRDAVLAYAGNPSERERPDSRAARERFAAEAETADPNWAGALAAFPDRLGYERAMVQALAERDAGADDEAAFRAALETTPSTLQSMFVNAAQSYAFNEVLSRRLDRGLPLTRPVAGDVVCFADRVETPDGGTLAVPDADRCQRVDADRVEPVRRHCERGRAFVALPLVGMETEFAEGQPGEIERAVCADLGIAPADFDLPEPFASRGTRRAAAVRADVTVDLEAPGSDADDAGGAHAADAYTLSFALPSGSYATVVCREFLKVSPERL